MSAADLGITSMDKPVAADISEQDAAAGWSAGTIGRYRWVICALLFAATTINYVDRSVLAVLSPTLKDKIGWTDTQYGDMNAKFQAA